MVSMKLGKVLVTDVGRLMGAYVVSELAGKAEVHGFDIVTPEDTSITDTFTQGTIEDFNAVREAVTGCDAVVHTAARPKYLEQ